MFAYLCFTLFINSVFCDFHAAIIDIISDTYAKKRYFFCFYDEVRITKHKKSGGDYPHHLFLFYIVTCYNFGAMTLSFLSMRKRTPTSAPKLDEETLSDTLLCVMPTYSRA